MGPGFSTEPTVEFNKDRFLIDFARTLEFVLDFLGLDKDLIKISKATFVDVEWDKKGKPPRVCHIMTSFSAPRYSGKLDKKSIPFRYSKKIKLPVEFTLYSIKDYEDSFAIHEAADFLYILLSDIDRPLVPQAGEKQWKAWLRREMIGEIVGEYFAFLWCIGKGYLGDVRKHRVALAINGKNIIIGDSMFEKIGKVERGQRWGYAAAFALYMLQKMDKATQKRTILNLFFMDYEEGETVTEIFQRARDTELRKS